MLSTPSAERPASSATPLAGVRIAIAYDCLFPWTVGGAERWYRCLAEAAATAGAEVTYLTRVQWDERPTIGAFDVVAVSGPGRLYDDAGTRLLGPTVRFGVGCARHLLRHRDDYDLVHVANFPFWSLLAARFALAGSGRPVLVDWHEIWSLAFWRSYAGKAVGTIGFFVQRLCLALSSHPVVTSARNGERLRRAGCRSEPVVLPGYLPAQPPSPSSTPAREGTPAFALFAGRHIRDKGIDLITDTAALLQRGQEPMDVVVAGDGPGRSALEAEVRARGLSGCVRFVGFVEDDELRRLLSEAAAVMVLSRREGYGMLVVEATSHGTPVVVADFEENLATDHVVEGVNGHVARPPTPEAVAAATRRVRSGGAALRASTLAWYRQASREQTIDHSAQRALKLYRDLLARP